MLITGYYTHQKSEWPLINIHRDALELYRSLPMELPFAVLLIQGAGFNYKQICGFEIPVLPENSLIGANST